MDKIEKIRAEIERRINILTNVYDELMERKDEEMMTYYHGKVIALEELCPFLDTLSEEPDKEDLNDEIKKFIEEYGYERGGDKLLIAIVARHFAEWQKSQMMKDGNVILAEEDFNAEKEKSIEWGYNLCKQQMIKDAVEADVNTYELTPGGSAYVEFVADMPVARFRSNDKVRIIIVKEDEK